MGASKRRKFAPSSDTEKSSDSEYFPTSGDATYESTSDSDDGSRPKSKSPSKINTGQRKKAQKRPKKGDQESEEDEFSDLDSDIDLETLQESERTYKIRYERVKEKYEALKQSNKVARENERLKVKNSELRAVAMTLQEDLAAKKKVHEKNKLLERHVKALKRKLSKYEGGYSSDEEEDDDEDDDEDDGNDGEYRSRWFGARKNPEWYGVRNPRKRLRLAV